MQLADPGSYSGAASYLLEFEKPLGTPQHQARYYIGLTGNLANRLARHRRGQAAAITRACLVRRIHVDCIRYWPHANEAEARAHERQLKRQKNHRRFIPK